jgi:hypothetical protein
MTLLSRKNVGVHEIVEFVIGGTTTGFLNFVHGKFAFQNVLNFTDFL